MMVFFFSIPMWLIAFLLLGAIGIASQLVSWIVFFIYGCAGIISWVFSYGFLREKREESGIISQFGLVVIFVIGMLCTELCAYIFSRKGARLSGFMVVMLVHAIACVIFYFLDLSDKLLLRIFGIILIFLSIGITAMWSIGYDISYTLKADYRNVAYFECITIKKNGWGSTGKVYNSLSPSRTAVGSFEVGDKYYPADMDFAPIYNLYQGLKYQADDLWPIEYNGVTAYVPSVNFEPRYWRESDFTDKTWDSVVEWKRYKFLPNSFLHTCEALFDHFPFGIPFVLVST